MPDNRPTTSAATSGTGSDVGLVVQVFDELAAAGAVSSGPEHTVRAVNRAVFGLTGPDRRLLFDRRGTGTLDEVYLSFSVHPTTVDGEPAVLAHAVDVTAMTPGGEPVQLRAAPQSAAAHVLDMVDLSRLVIPSPAAPSAAPRR